MFDYIKEDLKRFQSGSASFSFRTLVAGMLSPGFQALCTYRFLNWCLRHNIPTQPLRYFIERIVEITTGISIPARVKIGKGLRIHHFGGIIFHPIVELGDHCTLYHQVTIGDRGGYGGAAKIGNNVLIGAGAKIIGDISIGNNCKIGANAVVDKNMPPETIAYGNPAKYKKREVTSQIMAIKQKSSLKIMDFRGTYKGGGGPDKTILNSAKMHDSKRVSVLVTYLRDPLDKEFQITDRARQMGIPFVEVLDRRLLDISCLIELHGLVKKHDIEMIHAHDDKTLLYGWLLKMINPGLIIVFTCHLLVDYDRNDFASLKGYLNYLLRDKIAVTLMKGFLKPIMAVSGATKKQLINRGFSEKEISVLYNGINIDTWKRSDRHNPVLRKELNIGKDDFLVGTVARISYQKDFSTFIRVGQNGLLNRSQILNLQSWAMGKLMNLQS